MTTFQSFKPHLLVAASVGMGLFAAGCSSPCADLQNMNTRCGVPNNRAHCDQNIGSCTAADVRTIENAVSCEDNAAVCNNGAIVDAIKWGTCSAQLASVSAPCLAIY